MEGGCGGPSGDWVRKPIRAVGWVRKPPGNNCACAERPATPAGDHKTNTKRHKAQERRVILKYGQLTNFPRPRRIKTLILSINARVFANCLHRSRQKRGKCTKYFPLISNTTPSRSFRMTLYGKKLGEIVRCSIFSEQ